jgi:hypothetical protein
VASLQGTMTEVGTSQFLNWAEWERVLFYLALGSLRVSTLQEMEPSVSASQWPAIWDSAW